MLTNEIVLKVFSDYLARDDDFEVIRTSKGYTVMGFDCYRQDWNTVDFCPTPKICWILCWMPMRISACWRSQAQIVI